MKSFVLPTLLLTVALATGCDSASSQSAAHSTATCHNPIPAVPGVPVKLSDLKGIQAPALRAVEVLYVFEGAAVSSEDRSSAVIESKFDPDSPEELPALQCATGRLDQPFTAVIPQVIDRVRGTALLESENFNVVDRSVGNYSRISLQNRSVTELIQDAHGFGPLPAGTQMYQLSPDQFELVSRIEMVDQYGESGFLTIRVRYGTGPSATPDRVSVD